MKIPVKDIVVPDERARARYTEEQRAFLRASLGKYGQLSDILVRPLPDGRYQLIDGESRLRELMKGGASDVEVKVLHLDDRDASIVNLLMNVARGEQDPMGACVAINRSLEQGMSEEEIAKATGHTPGWVSFMAGLKELSPEYQEALREGRLLVTHIREALRLPDLKEADAALQAALDLGWNTSVMHHYVNNRLVEYETARARSETTGIPVPPPPPEPTRLVKYGQCLVHGGMVPREDLHLPSVCSGCYEIAKYVTSQFGTGEDGMQAIYGIYQRARAWDALQRPVLPPGQEQTQPPPTPSPPPPPPAGTPLPEKPVVIEDEKLRTMVRRIMREEMERREG